MHSTIQQYKSDEKFRDIKIWFIAKIGKLVIISQRLFAPLVSLRHPTGTAGYVAVLFCYSISNHNLLFSDIFFTFPTTYVWCGILSYLFFYWNTFNLNLTVESQVWRPPLQSSLFAATLIWRIAIISIPSITLTLILPQ